MPEITVYSRTPRTAGGFECGGQRITLSGPIKSGGEGMIYAVKYSDGICAKVYHRNKINAELRDKVKATINNPPGDNLTGETESSHSSLISWAISALYDSNLPDAHFLGFTMPLIDTSMFREAHRYYDPDDRIKYMGGTFTWLYLLTAAFNIASVVSAIHLKGHRIGDMSASNILVARTAAVSFIDCDSFQITDAASKKTYYTKVATGDFLPPELMGVNFRTDNIDRYYSDLFALGVMIFKFLMNGFHPYQARGAGVDGLPTIEAKIKQGKFAYEGTFPDVRPPKNAPPYAMISPELRSLFHRCFVTGHSEKEKRPAASEWAAALKNEIANIQKCDRNDNHYFSGGLKRCPWCAVMAANPGRKDPFPAGRMGKGNDAQKAAVAKPVQGEKEAGRIGVGFGFGGGVGFSQPQKAQPAKTSTAAQVTPGTQTAKPQPSAPAQQPVKTAPVKTNPPILSVTPDSAEIKVMRDGDAEFVIKVENKGEGTLEGTLRSDSDWLTFTAGNSGGGSLGGGSSGAAGTTAANTPAMTRTSAGKSLDFSAVKIFEAAAVIRGSKLPAGVGAPDAIFTGIISVSSNGGRAEIPVKVAFAKDPKLETDRGKIIIKDADIASNAEKVIRSEFTVKNGGDGILTGTITPNKDWIRAVPDRISTADSITVAVEIDTEKAPNSVLLFGKINIETNGGSAEITVGVTIQK
ncbi:MAG: hypothetical protein II893_06610 [Methanomicrobium sp.]|nr:hypothetical protein [Methanomicrobium sp.]